MSPAEKNGSKYVLKQQLSEDPERFHELINEINSILRREQQRLHALQTYNFHALAPSDQDPKQ